MDRAEQKKIAEISDLERAEELRELLSKPASRRALARIVAGCGVFKSSMTGNSETYALEGERRIGLRVIAMIERDAAQHLPEFLTLTREFTHG